MSVISPHKADNLKTISRWLKQLLSADAGIDVVKYSAHTNIEATVKYDLANIVASVGYIGWKSSQTFERFYRKPRELGLDHFSTQVAVSACFGAVVMSSDDHELTLTLIVVAVSAEDSLI